MIQFWMLSQHQKVKHRILIPIYDFVVVWAFFVIANKLIVFGTVLLIAVKSDLVITFFDVATDCTTLSRRVQLVSQNKFLAVPVALIGQDPLKLAEH